MNRTKIKEAIQRNEGCIDHMYLDTRGNVTIGVGMLVPSAEFAETLKLTVRDTDEPASDPQIVEEFNTVSAQTPGLIASSYKLFTHLYLSQTEIDAMLDQRIDEFTDGLESELKDFGQFPDGAQEALLDMAFNLGVSGLLHKFPKLVRAAGEQDWQTCAAECKRRGISEQRNQQTQQLFEAACEMPSA